MRKLLPYLGIAVAVAGGIALAPFFWWIVAVAVVCGCAYWVWSDRESVAGALSVLGMLVAIGLFLAWPGWFFWHRRFADGFTVIALYAVLILGPLILEAIKPYWLKVFPD